MTPRKKEPDMSTYSGRLAARLRHLRELAGLSVSEVLEQLDAAGIKVAMSAYYSWEAGTRQVPLDIAPALAPIFGLKHPRSLFPLD